MPAVTTAEEGDFVNLVSKHDFTMVSFGMMCGVLYDTLAELTIMRCSDFFNVNVGAFGTIACLKALRSLHIEDLHCRLDQEGASKLSKLTQVGEPPAACPARPAPNSLSQHAAACPHPCEPPASCPARPAPNSLSQHAAACPHPCKHPCCRLQLTELSLTLEQHSSNWLIGLEKIPSTWANLVSLRHLTLRGHGQLTTLPHFLTKLQLNYLDVSNCKLLSFELLPSLTSLETLCLQVLVVSAAVLSPSLTTAKWRPVWVMALAHRAANPICCVFDGYQMGYGVYIAFKQSSSPMG